VLQVCVGKYLSTAVPSQSASCVTVAQPVAPQRLPAQAMVIGAGQAPLSQLAAAVAMPPVQLASRQVVVG
jgi:hypothetical protein